MRADAVQEVAIVRDDHHRAVALVGTPSSQRIALMSRLFVGSSSSGTSRSPNNLREQNAQLQPGATPLIAFVLERNADAEQQFTGARFGVTVELRELDFEIGHLHAVLFTHLRQRIDPVALLLRARVPRDP